MATTLRRIQRLEADFRRYHRELDQQELRKKYDRSVRISRKSLEYCEKQMDEVQEQLDYWKKVVAEHEDQGLKVWGPDDFSVGQRILAHGRPAVNSEGQSQDLEGDVRSGVDERPEYHQSTLRRSEPEV
jgi:hypothetical protein